eukprot:m.97570 g.97570  ORF g.97570 m.97570 type:complete len:257 (+) comp13602_c0_seq1:118-888(+)
MAQDPKWDGWWECDVRKGGDLIAVWSPYPGRTAYLIEKAYRETDHAKVILVEDNNVEREVIIKFGTMTEVDKNGLSRSVRRTDTRFGGIHWGRKKKQPMPLPREVKEGFGSNYTLKFKQGSIGEQPAGSLELKVINFACIGSPKTNTIHISYDFHDGEQTKEMPSPGQKYTGDKRNAFYPNTNGGVQAAQYLIAAFKKGKLFKIGTSLSTGKTNTLVWGIKQKSRLDGGAEQHGWPDPNYFQELESECKQLGITID